MRLGAIILAAGAATRMGRVKQLLPYKGSTLVGNAILQAQQAAMFPVVVVLGAHAEAVNNAVANTSADIVENEGWKSGMGSSLTAGLDKILELAPDLEAVAILLADQPFVTGDQLREMGRVLKENSAPILAASYGGTVGVPAMFRRSMFEQLRQLPPDAGARTLLRGGVALVAHFELPEAATDIDTPADFEAIKTSQ